MFVIFLLRAEIFVWIPKMRGLLNTLSFSEWLDQWEINTVDIYGERLLIDVSKFRVLDGWVMPVPVEMGTPSIFGYL